MRKLSYLFLLTLSILSLKSQTTITIGSGTLTSGTTNSSPINIYFRSHHCQILYTAAEINNAGYTGPGTISKLGFNIFGTTTEALPNFSIKLKNTTSSDLSVYDANGLTSVYNSSLYLPTAGGFELLNLSQSFIWDGSSNLLVDVCFDQVGSYSASGEVYTYTYTSSGSEYEYSRDDNSSQCAIATVNTNSADKPQIQFEITALSPCTGNPIGGNVISDHSLACANTSFNLTLINGSSASGLVYQWQSSPNGTTYTNIGSSQTSWNYTIPSLSSTTYYRCITTCTNSTFSATSAAVSVSPNSFYNCYCSAPILNCFNGDVISKVTLSNLSDSTMTCSTGAYEDRSSYDTILLVANQSYTFNINSNYSNEKISYWIDFNKNGIFETNEYYLLTNSSIAGVNTNTLQVPITTGGGLTKMRLMLENGSYISSTPCSSSSYYGTTLDYLLDITAAPICSLTPNAGNAVTTSTSVCSNVSYTLDLVGNSISSGITYQWQNSLNGSTWTNLTAPQNIIPYAVNSQNVTNYYRCITTCTASAISATSTPVTVLQNSFLDCYCYPGQVACSNGATMTNILIAGVSYTPACDPTNNYYDVTGTSSLNISLTANQSYSISTDITSSFPTAYVGAWIDYNQNGIYDDIEYIAVGTSTGGNIVASFTVPYTALGGNTHLRLKMESAYSATTLSACTNNNYEGQTVDYLVNMIAAAPCSGTTNAGLTISSSPSVCSTTTFTLDLNGNAQVGGLTYQWQSSANNISWANIGVPQNIVPYVMTNQTSNTFYRCLVTCSASASSTSTPVNVIQNSWLYCYCTPPVTSCNFGNEISKVELSSLTNTSSCSSAGYIDYSGSVPTLSLDAGQTYSINVKVGSDYSNYVSAWIDYDHNGVFDTNEYTNLGSTSGAGDSTVYSSITIPINAILGNTKLRIRNNNGISFTSSEPCSAGMAPRHSLTFTGNGETEDYMIHILPQNCSTINFPPTMPAVGTATICYGETDTLNLSSTLPAVTGITYQWKASLAGVYVNEGLALNTTSIAVTPTTSTSYYCEIMCNGTVILNSDTVFVTVKPSTGIYGTVLTSTTVPVAGRVILYKYEPFFTKFDSVAGQNIGSLGDYNFTSFNSGIYIVKAIPALNNLQITYGNSAVNWKTATQITHGCSINDIHNIDVIALSTFTTTGTGSLSGKISEGQGFGHKMNQSMAPTTPGNPIGGIVVKGGRNPGGQMFVQTITDPSTGTYTLSGLPDNTAGYSYFILVDIPGLDTNHTYHRVITSLNNNYQGLDFVVDSTKINPIPSSVTSIIETNGLSHDIKIYPNPATNFLTIQYVLERSSDVKIELVDILGKTVRVLLPESKQTSDQYKNTWTLSELKSGLYFLKMTINNSETIVKISITN